MRGLLIVVSCSLLFLLLCVGLRCLVWCGGKAREKGERGGGGKDWLIKSHNKDNSLRTKSGEDTKKTKKRKNIDQATLMQN